MSTSSPARKRTQFASFLTEAASDLTGFEPAAPPATKPAEPDHSSVSTHPSLTGPQDAPEILSLAADRAGGVGELGAAAASRTEKVGRAPEIPKKVGSSGSSKENGSPRPVQSDETIKISVKVDARTFLRLKRSLELRETLQDFCLNAIKAELAVRTGNS